jgi:hypothetical protein
MDFDEKEVMRVSPMDGKPLTNFWGYGTHSYFAPQCAYCILWEEASHGDYARAEPLQQVLRIRLKVLGSEHPHTAESLNNLALLYCSGPRAFCQICSASWQSGSVLAYSPIVCCRRVRRLS